MVQEVAGNIPYSAEISNYMRISTLLPHRIKFSCIYFYCGHVTRFEWNRKPPFFTLDRIVSLQNFLAQSISVSPLPWQSMTCELLQWKQNWQSMTKSFPNVICRCNAVERKTTVSMELTLWLRNISPGQSKVAIQLSDSSRELFFFCFHCNKSQFSCTYHCHVNFIHDINFKMCDLCWFCAKYTQRKQQQNSIGTVLMKFSNKSDFCS